MDSRHTPLRVALLCTSVNFGGIERVLLNLLEHMDREVELVPIVFTRTETTETSFFHRLRALGIVHEKLFVNSVRPIYIVNPLVNLAQAISLIRRQRFDLIHSHGYRADVFGLLVAKWLNIPLVSTCHGFVSTDSRLKLYNALNTFVLRWFTRVIAVSTAMKDNLITHGLPPDRIAVITNAVPGVSGAEHAASRQEIRTRLGLHDRDFVFGFVGRLSEEKGVHFLLQAAGEVMTRHPQARILIVGDGPRREELQRDVRDRGLDHAVHFAGFQGDTAPWYSAMDAFVLPSLTEGTPMALLEAMAHRLPAVATTVGGVPAVVRDGTNGLLVPAADPSRLRDAMQSLLLDGALRGRLAENGWQSVHANFAVRPWIHRVRELYLSTVLRPQETA